jgi:hypothetical protein
VRDGVLVERDEHLADARVVDGVGAVLSVVEARLAAVDDVEPVDQWITSSPVPP